MANSARLPALPKDKDFEEYVAACYKAGGRYVEQRLIERDPVEFMELDVVATD